MNTDAIKARAAEVYAAYGLRMPTQGNICCPLGRHEDHHPSFRIRADGAWFCSCDGGRAGGDVIHFIRCRDDCDFKTAVATITDILDPTGQHPPWKPTPPSADELAEKARRVVLSTRHGRVCTALGQLRQLNGPEPQPVGTEAWWTWRAIEADLDLWDAWIDYEHTRAGGSIAPRLSMPWLDTLFVDEDGTFNYARFYAAAQLFD